jgi:hypothetical protein
MMGSVNDRIRSKQMNNKELSPIAGSDGINVIRSASGQPPGGAGCTQALVTGLTSLSGNMTGQCVDGSAGMWPGFIKLVIPDKGNRYLTVGGAAEEIFPLLNEKGIACSQGLRITKYPLPPSGKPGFIPSGEMMRTCNSADKYVKMWTENYMRHGAPWGGRCNLVVDPEVGYCLEGANFVYDDPANHTVHGPMYDQVFVSANFYISKRLKMIAEAGIGAGYNRAKRLWALLVDRQYDSTVMQPRLGGISLSYFMKCLRDHGNVRPEDGKLSSYISEERGDSALCCHGLWEYTSNAFIGIARPDHTDLFSCEWMTSSQPCISPFLPIYIGINKAPEALSTTRAYELFEKLRFAVEYHPEYREEITHYWSVFEIQAIEESYLLEGKVAPLVDKGQAAEAREMLTVFVQKKCDESMTACEKMLEFLSGLPVLGKWTQASPE